VGLTDRIDRAAVLLYVFGIFALVFGLIDLVPMRSLNLLASGIVTYAIQLEQAGGGAGASALKVGAVLAFFALAFAVHRRMLWGAIVAFAFVAFDGAFLFIFAHDVWSGLYGSLQVGFHALVCWSLADAGIAMNQWRVNEGIVRSLGVEASLKRKLEDSDMAPPPAATFTRSNAAPRPPQPEPRA
jgi:hypothetical protein